MRSFKTWKETKDLKEYVSGFGSTSPPSSPNGIDGDISSYDIGDPLVLMALETYVGALAERDYLNPYFPVNRLRQKLATTGLGFGQIPSINEGGDVLELPLTQFGGRFGKLSDESADIGFDDGITHRLGHGLALRLEFARNEKKRWEINAELVKTGLEEDGVGFAESNGYIAHYNGKKVEITADSLYAAKVAAVKQLNVPKSKQGLLSVNLAQKDGKQVTTHVESAGELGPDSIDKKISTADLDAKIVFGESMNEASMSLGPDSVDDIAHDIASRISNKPSLASSGAGLSGIFKEIGHPELNILRAGDLPDDWDTRNRDKIKSAWMTAIKKRLNDLSAKRKQLNLESHNPGVKKKS